MENFMLALKTGLRFQFKGNLSTEDLFSLSLADLDALYKSLRRLLRSNEEESLLVVESHEDAETRLKVEIVKAIVADKLADREATKARIEKAAQKQKLLEVLARKQDASLEQMTEDQIKAALAAL